jgi:hypothetical protein
MVVNYILFNVFINFIVFDRLNTKKDINYPVKKNSLIHAFIASLGGSLYLTNLISFHTQELVVYYSLGYIIYDVLIYTLYKEIKDERSITYFHHSLFLIGILYYYQEPKIYSTLILSEISTIPLNLRWLKKQEGNVKWTKIYSYLFYISFFVFRVVNCSRILYIITDLKKKYLITTFSGLNYYWFYLMTKKLIKSLR